MPLPSRRAAKHRSRGGEYRMTMFDRHGADASVTVKAFAFGLMTFGLCIPMFAAAASKMEFRLGNLILFTFGMSAVCGVFAMVVSLTAARAAGHVWEVLMMRGGGTPYVPQHSHVQALEVRGRVREALAEYEAIIVAAPGDVLARMRAAELYAGKGGDPRRAAELFRDVQRLETADIGDDILASNRLVDLYLGPLGAPGRAMVELRRLVDLYPGSAAAQHARTALAAMKDDMDQTDRT